jgi:small conductance mechanosensitive channel
MNLPLEKYLDQAVALITLYGVNIIAALAIFVFGRWAAKITQSLLKKWLNRQKIDQTIISFVSNLVYTGILAFVIIAALSKLGIQTTSFVAIIGAAGLAIGLALQGSLSNFAAGVLMIIFRPFRAGDYVEGGGVAGVVEEINIFTTIMNTPDNKKIIVPNSTMMGNNIINYSANPTRRVDLSVGVGYNDDLAKVKQTLQEIIAAESRVLTDPAPMIAVSELAESSVNLVVRIWVKTGDYWDVYFAVTEAIKTGFDAAGISIPFPQQDVHLYSVATPTKE